MGGAMEKFPVNVHKYNYARKCVYWRKIRGHLRKRTISVLPSSPSMMFAPKLEWMDSIITFCNVHFRPKIQVNNVTSRSYCPKFPFTIYISMARYNIMLKVYRSRLSIPEFSKAEFVLKLKSKLAEKGKL